MEDRSLIKMVPWTCKPPVKKVRPEVSTCSTPAENPPKSTTVIAKRSSESANVTEKMSAVAEVAESPIPSGHLDVY